MSTYPYLLEGEDLLSSFEFQSALDLIDQEDDVSHDDKISNTVLEYKTTIELPSNDHTIFLSTISDPARKHIIMISAQIGDELYQEIALNKSGEKQLLNHLSGFLGKWTSYPLMGLKGSFNDISTLYFAAKRQENFQLIDNLGNRMWFDLRNEICSLDPKVRDKIQKTPKSRTFISDEYLANCYEIELTHHSNISSTLVKLLLDYNQNVININRHAIRDLQDYITHPHKWQISTSNNEFCINQQLFHDPKLLRGYVDLYGIHVRVTKDLEDFFFKQFFERGIPGIVKRYYRDIVIFESDTKLGNDRLYSILRDFDVYV